MTQNTWHLPRELEYLLQRHQHGILVLRNDLRVIHPLIWEMEIFTSASIKLLYKVDAAGHGSAACDSEGSRDAELSGKVIQNRDARRWPSAASPCSGEAPSRPAPMLFTQESEQERCHELRGSSPASPSTFPHAQPTSPVALVLCTPAPSKRSQISLSNCVCCPVARTPHSSIPCQLCNFQGNFSRSPGHSILLLYLLQKLPEIPLIRVLIKPFWVGFYCYLVIFISLSLDCEPPGGRNGALLPPKPQYSNCQNRCSINNLEWIKMH